MSLNAALLTYEIGLVSRLGTESLAGFTLCLPLVFLMGMMSAGGLGGGVASAVARATKDQRYQHQLIRTSITLAWIFGVFFAVLLGWDPFQWIGRMAGDVGIANRAREYAVIFFAAIPLLWVTNVLANIHRAIGNPRAPAIVGAVTIVVQGGVSYPLILGWGNVAGFGLQGAAWISALGFLVQALWLSVELIRTLDKTNQASKARQRSHVAECYFPILSIQVLKLSSSLSKYLLVLPKLNVRKQNLSDILWVGLPSSVNTLMAALTSVFVTVYVSKLGGIELAAYGVASRLESLLIPIIFSIGMSQVALVGKAWGLGETQRARDLVYAGAILSFTLTTVLGVGVTLVPVEWLRWMADSADVSSMMQSYLQIAAPCIGLLGLGLAFSFSCQGIKRPSAAFIAALVRLLLVWTALNVWNPSSLFGVAWISSASLLVFAVVVVVASGPFSPFTLKSTKLHTLSETKEAWS